MTYFEEMEIYQTNYCVDLLYRIQDAFYGTVKIILLNYLATMDEDFDAVSASESKEVRTIT